MRILVVGLLALLSFPVAAEPIPAYVLERDRKACIATNPRDPGIEEKCTCYILHLARSFTLQGYATAEGELRAMQARGVPAETIRESIPEIRNAARSCWR